MKREVHLPAFPLRIVSLVPSQTELLHYFGLEEEVVGITKFCIHPDDWYRSKQRVGGTKTVDIELVRSLKPDLIIGNKEENEQSDIYQLTEIAPVWMSDIFTMFDAMEMIEQLGEITGKQERAQTLIEEIKTGFSGLNSLSEKKSVLYFIWFQPAMIAGRNTFIDDLLSICGFRNFATGNRYPTATGNENPDYIFLSSEPFPFGEKHMEYFRSTYPNSEIVLVDGEYFSWYGSKLKDAPAYFNTLIASLQKK